MVADRRREGDDRPATHDHGIALTLTPEGHKPFRFLPKQGQPYCIGEWMSQHLIKWLSYWPVYVCVVATLILVTQFVILGSVR